MNLYSESTERAVLGGALLTQVLPAVELDDFHLGKHQRVWDALQTLAKENAPIDIITVCDKLKTTGKLWDGGAAYVTTLTNEVPTLAHMEHHAGRLRELAHARRVKAAAEDVARAIGNGEEANEAAVAFQKVLSESNTGEYVPVSMGELYSNRTKHYEQLFNKEKTAGIVTGYTDLDRLCPIADSDLVIVAGRPAMGKTAFAMGLARGIARAGRPVLFFNGEMSNEQIVDREVSSVAKVNGRKFRTGDFTMPDLESMTRAASRIGGLPLHVIRATRMTSGKVRAATAQFIARTGEKPVVIVDLLNAMREYKSSDRQAMFSDSLLGLDAMAGDFDLPCICLAQLGRSVEESNPPIPAIRHVKETGEAEQTAASVLLLYRQDYYVDSGKIVEPKDGRDTREWDSKLVGLGRIYAGKSRFGPT